MTEREFSEALVKDAGALLLSIQARGFESWAKGGNPKDIVTTADLEVNAHIINALHKSYPDDAVYSEEGGGSEHGQRLWVIDPIDGSSNFSRRIPHFAVSVGLIEDGVPVAGAVHNPVTKDCFSFAKGGGSFLNGVPVTVSKTSRTDEGYILFSAGRKDDQRQWGGDSYTKLLGAFKKTKNLGSSALDICFVGAGRVEALVYGMLTTKDIAPALGFLYEAGGVASDRFGAPLGYNAEPQRVYAANSQHMLDATRSLLEV